MVEGRGLELPRVTPGDVGAYLEALELSVPTKKLLTGQLGPERAGVAVTHQKPLS